jgi:hypothetical protein
MFQYALEVTSEAYDLCVFLNDGVEIETPDTTFLVFRIDAPREITSRVVDLHEIKSAQYKDLIFLKP